MQRYDFFPNPQIIFLCNHPSSHPAAIRVIRLNYNDCENFK